MADAKEQKSAAQKQKERAAEYGYALSFMRSEPEVWKKFEQAVKENWTPGKFLAELRETKFYRNHSDSYIAGMNEKALHPEEWKLRVEKQAASLGDIAANMGAQVPKKVLSQLASDIILYGWSGDQVQNKLAAYVKVIGDTGHYGGDAGINEGKLRDMAWSYGQKMSEKTLNSWVVNMARGSATLNDFKAEMQKMAEVKYPAYVEQIRKGLTVRDIAEPYVQEMAATLELNPENIDLFDKHIQRALTSKNPIADTTEKGGKSEFNMYDFGRQLRMDDRWKRTKQAQDQTMAMTRKIFQDWGFDGG
jgi:hypothetical protein